MMPSIVDVAGINKISKIIFKNAALAIAGMVGNKENLEEEQGEEKPLIAASMFGVTTPCVEQAKAVLEKAGYEVLVFHATGTGGKTMESLIESGFLQEYWILQLQNGVMKLLVAFLPQVKIDVGQRFVKRFRKWFLSAHVIW